MRIILAAFAFGCIAPAVAKPVNYQLPPETATLAAGSDSEVASANCSACHSVDYITTQPHVGNPAAFWTAEVTKMQKVYGASISDDDAHKIAAYLAATYGKPSG